MKCNCKNLTDKEIKRRNIIFVGVVVLLLGLTVWGGLSLSKPYKPSKLSLKLATVMDNSIADGSAGLPIAPSSIDDLYFTSDNIQIFYFENTSSVSVFVDWKKFDITEEEEAFLLKKAKAWSERNRELLEAEHKRTRAKREAIILKVKPIGEKDD